MVALPLPDNGGHERAPSRTRASSNAGLLSRIGRVSHLANFGNGRRAANGWSPSTTT